MQGSKEMKTQGSRVAGGRAASHLLCHPIYKRSHRSDCDQQMVPIEGREIMGLGLRPKLHAGKLLAEISGVCMMSRPVHGMCAWHLTTYMQPSS